jgi:DNA-directed RNA polymerase specialized sigma24 family protein
MTKEQAIEYIASKYDRIKNYIYEIDQRYFRLKGQYHEDITHDLFLKMYAEIEKANNDPSVINKILDRISDSSPFKLYNIVKNMYIDLIRREKKIVSIDDPDFHVHVRNRRYYAEQPEVILDSEKDIEEKIDEYVDSFYWFDRKVFNLYRYEFKNHTNNMSKATKLSVSTIYRTVKRCKVKINDKLKKQYYEEQRSRR